MNYNQEQKDLTQYSTKCAIILGTIFDSLIGYNNCQSETDKNTFINKISENISDFELTLDKCFIDVNESLFKIVKSKHERRNSNNINDTMQTESDIRRNQGGQNVMVNEEQISDEELINFIANKISEIKLHV